MRQCRALYSLVIAMEISSPKNQLRQQLLSAFRMLAPNNPQACFKAVQIFQSTCHDKDFAEIFIAMSGELETTSFAVNLDRRRQQVAAIMSGVRDLGAPVPGTADPAGSDRHAAE